MSDPALIQPRLRMIEVTPIEYQGRRMAALRDTSDPDLPPLAVSQEALTLLSLMDGSRTVAEICAQAAARWGISAPSAAVSDLVEAMDQACFLESDRHARHHAQVARAFAELPMRPAIHAGGAYAAAPEALRAFIWSHYQSDQGPGAPSPGTHAGEINAAIIPHVDLHRGGPTYAWAYHALAEAPPADCYLLLGTCHNRMSQPFAALRKPYDTPFGPAPVDMEFLEALARQLGPEVFADELAHRAEHSLEFQAVYLRGHDLVSVDSGRTIVPILCQALQAYIPPGESPATSTTAQRFIEAMMTTIARSGKRVCVIAGADLAHVGPQFGDPEPLTPAALNTVHQRDLEMLRHVCAGDGEGFYAQVMEDSDARRICGLAPIYYTLAITGANQGDLRKYTQWADPSATSAISFASVIFSAGRGRTGPEPALNTEPAPPL